MTEPAQVPIIPALIDSAKKFASLLSVNPPPDERLRETIEDVLFGRRDAFESARLGLMTEMEAVNLLLDDLYTLLVPDHSNSDVPPPWEDKALVAGILRGMFGPTSIVRQP